MLIKCFIRNMKVIIDIIFLFIQFFRSKHVPPSVTQHERYIKMIFHVFQKMYIQYKVNLFVFPDSYQINKFIFTERRFQGLIDALKCFFIFLDIIFYHFSHELFPVCRDSFF